MKELTFLWSQHQFADDRIDTATIHTEVAHDRQSQMQEHDPAGFGVTLISMSVGMLALAVLNLVFRALGKAMMRRQSRGGDEFKKGKHSQQALAAAIALALHEHAQLSRDEEIVNITIEQISRRYSPWNNRIYGVMNRPQR